MLIFKAQRRNPATCCVGLGPEVQWIESYVTADKIFCVYPAPSEKLIREHAERSGFPANKITRVERVIDPTTAERGGAAQAAA